MDKETAIKKIRKCMALAKSSEPHEAAAALRQAQKLMEQFGIEHPEILAAGITEDWGKSGATKIPARYEVHLAGMVCGAFGCEMLFSRKLSNDGYSIVGGYSFIGVTPSPEVAAYTFTVLRRQLAKARADYIKTALKRYRKNKTAAADMFCQGWVLAVQKQVSSVNRSEEQDQAIDAYKRVNYAVTSKLAQRERDLKGNSDNHLRNGWNEGKNARFNSGVSGNQFVMLEQ